MTATMPMTKIEERLFTQIVECTKNDTVWVRERWELKRGPEHTEITSRIQANLAKERELMDELSRRAGKERANELVLAAWAAAFAETPA